MERRSASISRSLPPRAALARWRATQLRSDALSKERGLPGSSLAMPSKHDCDNDAAQGWLVALLRVVVHVLNDNVANLISLHTHLHTGQLLLDTPNRLQVINYSHDVPEALTLVATG